MTARHAKYFAHELTKRCPSDSVGKLAASLADAQVDLNPRQIDAALFAFRSPLKARLKELEDALKIIKRQARLAGNLPLKLKLERECRNLDADREGAWKEYEEAARDIEKKKDSLIDEVERKLTQTLIQKKLFSVRWRLK